MAAVRMLLTVGHLHAAAVHTALFSLAFVVPVMISDETTVVVTRMSWLSFLRLSQQWGLTFLRGLSPGLLKPA